MFEGERFAFIGPGVMAEAMLNGLLFRAGVGPRSLTAGGPRRERLEELAQHYGISTTTDIRAAAADATVIVLSVKPQSLPAVLEGLCREAFPPVRSSSPLWLALGWPC